MSTSPHQPDRSVPIADWRRPEVIAVRSPATLGLSLKSVEAQWRHLGFRSPPNLIRAEREHRRFVELLKGGGTSVIELKSSEDLTLDAVYVRDASCITPQGMIACSMSKENRRAEPSAFFDSLGTQSPSPLIGRINAPGTLEGGDIIWLSDLLCAVGASNRSNASGIAQFKEFLGQKAHAIEVQLPYRDGPDRILHLSSLCSLVSRSVCVAYTRYLPSAFLGLLQELGFQIVPIAEEEDPVLAANVLVYGDGRVCMVAGAVRTAFALEQLGLNVETFEADNICLSGDGGPTCLTRPLTYFPD